MTVKRDIHAQNNPTASLKEVWEIRDSITLIDVRSPAEYAQGALPGAFNFPIFDNEERAVIGTLWKRLGHDRALTKGYEFLDASFQSMIERINQLQTDRPMYVYCAKGGLRSKLACNVMKLAGHAPIQVEGGYRGFRLFTHSLFKDFEENAHRVILLSGLAGAGKTLTLHHLDNSLDLEGCASHSGSAFGHIAVEPATTKQFEARLADRLDRLNWSRPIYMEAESRRIGLLSIPGPIWARMLGADHINVTSPLRYRVERVKSLYVHSDARSQKQLLDATQDLKRFFSNQRFGQILDYLAERDFDKFLEILLLEHYDGKYRHILKKQALFSVDASSPFVAASEICRLESSQ